MSKTTLALGIVSLAVVAAAGFGAYRYGITQGMQMSQVAAPAANAKSERTVLYWHDPMKPEVRFDKPGKSPFMDMDLVPVYADEAEEPGIKVAPGIAQSLGIRTVEAHRASLQTTIDAVGTLEQNERATEVVQSRVTGYVEQLNVRATLDPVIRGQTLAVLHAPDWTGALNEYVALKHSNVDPAIVQGARERLRLLQIPEDVVAQSERTGNAQSRFTLVAPISGIVAELGVRQGAMASPGMVLFRIVDLSTGWALVEVPEAQAGQIRVGASVEARAEAYPERSFRGKLSAILPEVNAATRTLRARVELANPGQVLKPGMFVRLTLSAGERREALVIPQEAVIATGKRNVVVVARESGRFEPREVELGKVVGADVEVRSGLAEGERVVASGQFLLDSEASLKGALTRLDAAAPAQGDARAGQAVPARAPKDYTAEGVVERADGEELTITHGPVPALKWPAMTMGFKRGTAGRGVKAGERIRFGFIERDGEYELTRVERLTGARK